MFEKFRSLAWVFRLLAWEGPKRAVKLRVYQIVKKGTTFLYAPRNAMSGKISTCLNSPRRISDRRRPFTHPFLPLATLCDMLSAYVCETSPGGLEHRRSNPSDAQIEASTHDNYRCLLLTCQTATLRSSAC